MFHKNIKAPFFIESGRMFRCSVVVLCVITAKKKRKGRKSSEEKMQEKKRIRWEWLRPPQTPSDWSPRRGWLWWYDRCRLHDPMTAAPSQPGRFHLWPHEQCHQPVWEEKKCVTICRVLNKTQFQMQAKWFILWMLVTKRASLLWQCLIPKDTCSSFSVQQPNSHSIGGL